MQEKICTKCKICKTYDEFPLQKSSKTGRHSNCKNCMCLSIKSYYKTDKGKKSQQKYQDSVARIDKICKNCSKEFIVRLVDSKRGRGIFCSISCASKYNACLRNKYLLPNVKCSNCNNELYRNTSRKSKSKSGLFFCNRKCKDFFLRLENGPNASQPPHFGSGESSYKEIAFRDLPHKCNRCGYDKYPIFEVHHKDYDRTNNKLENLEILCPTCHEEHHFLTKTGKWLSNDNKLFFGRINFPDKEEMIKLIWSAPISKLEKISGFSEYILNRYCKLMNIEKPPLGYWIKK